MFLKGSDYFIVNQAFYERIFMFRITYLFLVAVVGLAACQTRNYNNESTTAKKPIFEFDYALLGKYKANVVSDKGEITPVTFAFSSQDETRIKVKVPGGLGVNNYGKSIVFEPGEGFLSLRNKIWAGFPQSLGSKVVNYFVIDSAEKDKFYKVFPIAQLIDKTEVGPLVYAKDRNEIYGSMSAGQFYFQLDPDGPGFKDAKLTMITPYKDVVNVYQITDIVLVK